MKIILLIKILFSKKGDWVTEAIKDNVKMEVYFRQKFLGKCNTLVSKVARKEYGIEYSSVFNSIIGYIEQLEEENEKSRDN